MYKYRYRLLKCNSKFDVIILNVGKVQNLESKRAQKTNVLGKQVPSVIHVSTLLCEKFRDLRLFIYIVFIFVIVMIVYYRVFFF